MRNASRQERCDSAAMGLDPAAILRDAHPGSYRAPKWGKLEDRPYAPAPRRPARHQIAAPTATSTIDVSWPFVISPSNT